ncbi:MAG: alpha/beta fold hydrolase [Gammaproteobacteria bacterium]|nr:alpha/beta fold hydrolase [Gammaproteobacteria bacterium]
MIYTINGKALAVDQKGAGAPVLLVHGLGGTSNFWAPVVAALAGVRQLIVPDLPSAGRSALDPQVSIASLVADLLALLDALGLDTVQLIGHSMGTIVCQHLAVRAPTRVSDLVLLGPLAEPPDAARPALRERAATVRKAGMAPVAEVICERGLSAATKAHNPIAAGFVREMLLGQNPESYAVSCLALAASTRAESKKITCETLLISGTEDTTSSVASVEALRDALPHAGAVFIPNCGHWTAVEMPLEVNATIGKFYGL